MVVVAHSAQPCPALPCPAALKRWEWVKEKEKKEEEKDESQNRKKEINKINKIK